LPEFILHKVIIIIITRLAINLRIKLSVVQSWAPTFDPELVKNIKKPQISAKKACNTLNKKGVLASTDAGKKTWYKRL